MKTLPKIIEAKAPKRVLKMEASSNYTYLTYKNGDRVISAYSLKVFAELFEAKHFIRINRSVLVNIEYIKQHFRQNGKEYLRLEDGSSITIPRRKIISLKSQYPRLFENKTLVI